MLPAYQMPLSDGELALIGAICAIQGQIEFLMLMTVQHLLGLDVPLARRVMGSTSIETNTTIWLEAVRSKCSDPEGAAWAAVAATEIKDLAAGRNDFVHGTYAFNQDTGDAIAMRIRSDKTRPVSDLEMVRDQAARVSNIVALVNWISLGLGRSQPQPSWRDRLGPLPAPPPPKAAPRSGKGP